MDQNLVSQRERVFALRKQLRQQENILLRAASSQGLEEILFPALDVRVVNALREADVITLDKVLEHGILEKVPGLGRQAIARIRHVLAEKKFFVCLENPHEGL